MNFRIPATILVIAAGIIGSYFILKTPLPAPEKPAESNLKTPSDLLNQNSGEWYEKISDKLDQEVKNLSQSNSVSEDEADNATKKAAQALFESMREKDQSGANPFEALSTNPDDPQNKKIIEEISAALEDSDSFFEPSVSYQDLKISANNSKEAKTGYLKNILEISQNYLNNPRFQRTSDQLMADINSDCFGSGGSINKELSQAYKKITADYLAAEVPSEWALLHKNIIVHFRKSELIYGSIAGCIDDPIKGYAAVKKLPEVLASAQEIQAELTQNTKLMGI